MKLLFKIILNMISLYLYIPVDMLPSVSICPQTIRYGAFCIQVPLDMVSKYLQTWSMILYAWYMVLYIVPYVSKRDTLIYGALCFYIASYVSSQIPLDMVPLVSRYPQTLYKLYLDTLDIPHLSLHQPALTFRIIPG